MSVGCNTTTQGQNITDAITNSGKTDSQGNRYIDGDDWNEVVYNNYGGGNGGTAGNGSGGKSTARPDELVVYASLGVGALISPIIRNAPITTSIRLKNQPLPGFVYDEKKGIYYSPIAVWQRKFGYADIYDVVFDRFCDTEYEKFIFEYQEKEWRIEFWKGRYWNMGTGAEIGIYYKEIGDDSDFYAAVNDDDFMKMSFSLYQNDPYKYLFTRGPEEHWWLNGFKPDENVKAADIVMVGNIELIDSEMFNIMYDKFEKSDNFRTLWTKDLTITFEWKTK